MGACTMGMLRALPFVLFMGVAAVAQSPTYGVGRTPSAEEIRAWDISIGPTGAELPPGLDNTIQPWRIASDGSVHNGNA